MLETRDDSISRCAPLQRQLDPVARRRRHAVPLQVGILLCEVRRRDLSPGSTHLVGCRRTVGAGSRTSARGVDAVEALEDEARCSGAIGGPSLATCSAHVPSAQACADRTTGVSVVSCVACVRDTASFGLRRGGRVSRQPHGERGAVLLRGFNRNGPAMSHGDLLGDVQPQTEA
jgi:ribosomal protein L35AE/L33A